MIISLKIILSFVLLYVGAELTLWASEKIGKALRLSPLLIGLLFVGFGTSLPEMFVSHIAMFNNGPEMAIGNLIGSNIGNLFLILGITGLLVPLCLKNKEIFKQLVWHVGLIAIVALVLVYKKINYISGGMLLIFFIIYIAKSIKHGREEKTADHIKTSFLSYLKYSFIILIGFGLLFYSGDLLVNSGKHLCILLGLSEYSISVIFFALGTSFPELITSLVACYKKKDTELIIGNIIGSNLFNLAAILGSLGFYKLKLDSYWVELCILGLMALYLLFLSFKKKRFSVVSGIISLCIYGGMVFFWATKTNS